MPAWRISERLRPRVLRRFAQQNEEPLSREGHSRAWAGEPGSGATRVGDVAVAGHRCGGCPDLPGRDRMRG